MQATTWEGKVDCFPVRCPRATSSSTRRGAYGDGDLPPVSTESRRHRRWCVWFDDCLSHPEQAPSDAV